MAYKPAPWQAFQVPTLPPVVGVVSSAVSGVVDTAIQVLTLVEQLVSGLAKIEIDRLSVSQLAVKVAVTTLQKTLDQALKGTGLYVLLVPARKRIVIAPAVSRAMSKLNLSALPGAAVTADVLGLQAAVATGYGKFDPVTATFFTNSASAQGGNAGFYRTVLESLADSGDPNRPPPDPANYVAAATVVAGASDYASLLGFMMVFGALLPNRRGNSVFDVPDLPVPQNLRATMTQDLNGSLAALLSWDYQTPIVHIPALDQTVFVDRVAVIRSTDPAFVNSRTPLDLFGTNELRKGLATADRRTEVVAVYNHVVVAEKSTYYDTSKLFLEKPYYYAVCYSYKTGTRKELVTGKGRSQGFGALSGMVKVLWQPAAGRVSSGTPPDWIRTPSAVDVFPALGLFFRQVLVYVEQLEKTTVGSAGLLKGYAAFLKREIESLSLFAGNVLGVINRFVQILSQPFRLGAHVRGFSGPGGVPAYLADLAQGLADQADPMRPQFDNGDEFVLGFVVMATAPSEVGVNAAAELIKNLFARPEEAAITQAVIGQLRDVVDAEAQALREFGPAFEEAQAAALEAPENPFTFGVPEETACYTNVALPPAKTITFADDLSPR